MRCLRPMLVCALLLTCGCRSAGTAGLPPWQMGKAVRISEVRGPLPGTKTVTMEIPRDRYIKALETGNVNTVRLVEVYSRYKVPETPPEYRLFDVRPGSVYDVLGLQTSDVILAADGYVIPAPQIFWQFLNLVRNLDKTSIELVRGGRPIVFEYTLVPPVKPATS